MEYVIYRGDVHSGESITKADVKELRVVRRKTLSGHYEIVATDAPADCKEAPKGKGK